MLLTLLSLASLAACSALKFSQQCQGWECLNEYVHRDDGSLDWRLMEARLEVEDYEGRGGWTAYYLNMTSQTWLSEEVVSRSHWWHVVVVIVPHNLRVTDTAVLWITDGSNKENFLPDLDIAGQFDYNLLVAADIATASGIVVANLYQIPNAGIQYWEEPGSPSRSEDDSIAYTWLHYMEDPTNDTEYVLYMPMAKAGVRCMDAVTEFLTSATAPPELQAASINPAQWAVAGASKRGWCAWIVASVDPRVIALVPVVMDLLNFEPNIKHHFKAYGGWSWALEPYWKMNLTYYFEHPKFDSLASIIDPYAYRDKLVMPKLVINCGNDEFFNNDNARYWWDDMPYAYEMNKFLMLPNADHVVAGAILEVLPSINTWMAEILSARERLRLRSGGLAPTLRTIEERTEYALRLMEVSEIPRFSWTTEPGTGDITVTAETAPLSVHVWHASTCNTERRDFRFLNKDQPCECGAWINSQDLCINEFIFWGAEELQETEPGSLTWRAHKRPPIDDRWMALFVDLQFSTNTTLAGRGWPLGEEGVLEFTTTVSIIHRNGTDVFPYEECHGADCLGSIV